MKKRTDKQLLDWLENEFSETAMCGAQTMIMRMKGSPLFFVGDKEFESLREAINAAMEIDEEVKRG